MLRRVPGGGGTIKARGASRGSGPLKCSIAEYTKGWNDATTNRGEEEAGRWPAGATKSFLIYSMSTVEESN